MPDILGIFNRIWNRESLNSVQGPYVYQALSEANDHIRVLELQPGEWSTPIRFKLNERTFTEHDFPEYEALSYTWGDALDKRTVLVQSGQLYYTITVTKNCEEALKYIRKQNRGPRTLWIDAICINQQDLGERARQVTLMAAIYTRATRVLAWLGPASDDIHILLDWIEKVTSDLDMEDLSSASAALDDFETKDGGIKADITPLQVKALTSFIQRPWFSRLWIWQEIQLGRVKAILLCGDSVLSWVRFRAADKYLTGKQLPPGPETIAFSKRDGLVDQLCSGPRRNLLRTLRAMNNHECTDQRDRIYTAQAFGDGPYLAIQPDYTMSVEEVYTLSATTYVSRTNYLTFLEYVHHPTRLQNLPSWVPDWSAKILQPNVHLVNGQANAFSKAAVQRLEGGTITVLGRRATQIESATPYMIAESESLIPRAQAKALREFLVSVLTQTGSDVHIKSVARILSFGYEQERFNSSTSHYLTLEEWDDLVRSLIAGTSSYKQAPHISVTSKRMMNMAILHCKNGALAIGPAITRTSDIVAVLLGCPMPMVLRKGDDGTFKVIGPAYCEGITNGETILGPLPDSFQMVYTYDTDNELRVAFALRRKIGQKWEKTGQSQWNDPRLPDMPSQWWLAVRPEGPRAPPIYYNKETGEHRFYDQDPRCDAEALQARGVELEAFTLV